MIIRIKLMTASKILIIENEFSFQIYLAIYCMHTIAHLQIYKTRPVSF